MVSCARATRGLTYKKGEVQVEQQSIRLGVFSTLNLDLSHDLSMGRAQWKINQPPSLKREWAGLEDAPCSIPPREKDPPVATGSVKVPGLTNGVLAFLIHRRF